MNSFNQNISLAIFITLLGSTIVIIYSNFIYNAIKSYNRKSVETQIKYEELKNLQEKMLLETEIEIREQTFQYISKEIHDNITQRLSLANLLLNCLDPNSKDFYNQVEKCKTQVAKSLNDLNNLSKSLDSELIEAHGLFAAIDFEIERWKKFIETTITLNISGTEKRLSPIQELFIFRIIQESLNNIAKHSKATNANILLTFEESEATVEITDNGLGFDPDEILARREVGKMAGLKNIRQRAQTLGGNFCLQTASNLGTTIKVKIPFKHEHQNYSRLS